MEVTNVRKIKDIRTTSYSKTMLAQASVNGSKENIVVKKVIDKSDDAQSFEREVDALSNLSNPLILKILGYCQDRLEIYTEFFEGMPISDYIASNDKLSLKKALPIFKQCASALMHVHSSEKKQSYVHYDISGQNYLVSNDEKVNNHEKVILIDFGTSFKENKMPKNYKNSEVGALRYLSPEKLMHSSKQGKESDVYSLGVLMYEAFSGISPFLETVGNIKKQILNDNPFPVKTGSKVIDDAVMTALSKKPSDRPTAKELTDVFRSRM